MDIALLLLLAFVAAAGSFVSTMSQIPCEKELSIGQVIMDSKVVGSTQRFLRIFRGKREVFSGDIYHPLETLTVQISDIRDEYMYEVRGGASFRKGSCEGTRISSSESVTLVLPPYSATIGDIRILAGWTSASNEIKVTMSFILIRKDDAEHPRIIGWYEAINNQNIKLSKENNGNKIPANQANNRKITSDRDYKKLIDNSVIKTEKIKLNDIKREAINNHENEDKMIKKNNPEHLNHKSRDNVYDSSMRRVEMTSSERKREMEKIRDRELFGVHGHDSLNEQMYRKKNTARVFTKTDTQGTRRSPKRTFLFWKNINFLIFLWFLGIFVFTLFVRKLCYEKNKVFRYIAKIQTFDD